LTLTQNGFEAKLLQLLQMAFDFGAMDEDTFDAKGRRDS
jgi:hypothetical protein